MNLINSLICYNPHDSNLSVRTVPCDYISLKSNESKPHCTIWIYIYIYIHTIGCVTDCSLSFLFLFLSHHRSPSSCCCLQSAWCWTWRAPSCPVRTLSWSTLWRIVNWWGTLTYDKPTRKTKDLASPCPHSSIQCLDLHSAHDGPGILSVFFYHFISSIDFFQQISLLTCHHSNWLIHFFLSVFLRI